ncbi:hypothetical protein ACWGOQ_0016845 [Aquimarina sp. M1]
MAEIKIEKKKPVWPWLLLALLLIGALVYFFILSNNEEETREANEVEEIGVDGSSISDNTEKDVIPKKSEGGKAIATYSAYIKDDTKMGIDHEYSNNALLLLINAVSESADNLNIDIKADLKKARENAEIITEDPQKLTHANKIKNAGVVISKALGTIQKSKFPNLESELLDLENSIEKINPDVATLNQKEDVKNFFGKASEILIKMKK